MRVAKRRMYAGANLITVSAITNFEDAARVGLRTEVDAHADAPSVAFSQIVVPGELLVLIGAQAVNPAAEELNVVVADGADEFQKPRLIENKIHDRREREDGDFLIADLIDGRHELKDFESLSQLARQLLTQQILQHKGVVKGVVTLQLAERLFLR